MLGQQNWARKHVVSKRLLTAFAEARRGSKVDRRHLSTLGEAEPEAARKVPAIRVLCTPLHSEPHSSNLMSKQRAIALANARSAAAVARRRAVRNVASRTNFSAENLRKVQSLFAQVSGDLDGALSRMQFCEVDAAGGVL